MPVTKQDLGKYDFEIVVDASQSMQTEDCRVGRTLASRWSYAKETTLGLALAAGNYDDDGVTVVIFSRASDVRVFENITSEKVPGCFDYFPANSTDTGYVLETRINAYFERLGWKDRIGPNAHTESAGSGDGPGLIDGLLGAIGWGKKKAATPAPPSGGIQLAKTAAPSFKAKPLILVIMTDGRPDSEERVADAIIAASKVIKKHGGDRLMLGFSFVQVGYDKGATVFLDRLNNSLDDAAFDCVNSLGIDDLEDISPEEVFLKALTE